MSASSPSIAAARRGRPSAVRLATDQIGYAVLELWRSRVVAIFTFLVPLTWLLLFGVLAGNDAVDEETGVRVMQFVAPTAGVMGVLYATLPPVAITVSLAREQGVLKRLRGTPVPAWAYLAGRIGGAVVFALASFTAMLAAGVLLYDVRIIGRTLPATAVTVVVAIACFTALGLAVAELAPSAAVAQGGAIAAAVVLGMISGVMFYGDLPAAVDRVAAVLPLGPLHEALQDQFNPFRTGAGWDVGALATMVAWGLAGAVVAARAFRWDPPPEGRRREPHEAKPEVRPWRRRRRASARSAGWSGTVTAWRSRP